MNTYKPSQATPRGNIPELERYIFRELNRISASMDTLNNPITTLYAEPERPAEGEFQIADGAVWNPGSGFGLYQYLAGSWVLIAGQGGNSDIVPVSEVISLTDGQTTVVFTTYSTQYSGFYLSGIDVDSGRLQASDYTIVSDTTIELAISYPANTTITLLRNASEGSGVEPGGQVDSIVAGANVTVDSSDPANPIVSASGGGGGLAAPADTRAPCQTSRSFSLSRLPTQKIVPPAAT